MMESLEITLYEEELKEFGIFILQNKKKNILGVI